MKTDPTKFDDIIDSRDVIARIEDLRDEIGGAATAEELAADYGAGVTDEFAGQRAELATLEALAAEAESSPDWEYGETLIRDSYFKNYAQELADDCCPFPSNSPEGKALETWPYRCIDWQQAARELQQDYFSVEFDDVTYWIRG